ncbi:TPA: hypothetical protein N0F65_003470 [Lagenidium giganteum]|uniref:Tyrosine-protein kinase ephrin type A/B receptor-like domain-containing protein n=1 Tax=Lagenidium giganteum TaxID=4803 RepID=A0AAV2YMC0_9STRA|nr:TPA: hypothetical protein N0F65_003470 [Lagenidium giganteum]
MVLIGTDISDMHLADIERGWTKALLEYSADEFQPHAVNFEALTPTHDRVRIDVAFEAVVEHEPRRPLRWLAKFHKQIMEAKEFLMKMKDKLMNPMAALLGERSASGERASRTNVSQLVMFAPFQDCLRRSLLASNVSVPSPLLMQVSAAGEWRSHRTVMCPPGTAQITAGNGSRVCEPCPLGTFSNKGGQQQCTKCADGWYADQTGLTKCFECDPGEESTEDASGCRHCGWLVPGCPDFWDQVYYQGLIILTLMCSIFPKCREMCGGDRHAQQRSEGVALVAAVRTHGHVCLGRHRRHGGSPAIVSARHLLQELSSIRQSSQV